MKLLNRFFILIIISALCLSGCATNNSNIKWETTKATTNHAYPVNSQGSGT